jgi:hypothetical protein
MTLRAPIGLTEAAVDKFRKRDGEGEIVAEPELQALSSAMHAARSEVEKIVALSEAVAADPTMTPGRQALKVKEATVHAGGRAAEKIDAARAKAEEALQALRASTAAPAVPRGAPPLQAEIRQRLAAMTEKQRTEAINSAIKTGNDLILSAVLSAPALLSGMSDMQHALRVEQFRRARYPAEADRIDRLQKAIEAIDRGSEMLVSFIKSAATPEALSAESKHERAEALAAEVMK